MMQNFQYPKQDWLKSWNLYTPEAPALTDGDSGETWSYKKLFNSAQRTAEFLRTNYGIKKGDRILFVGLNSVPVISLFFACSRLGAILVPVNYRLTPAEIEYLISDADPQLIVFGDEHRGIVTEAANAFKQNMAMISLHELHHSSLDSAEFVDFMANEEDPALIIYTSGTTGKPKGAMIAYRALFWNAVSTSMRLNITQHDVAVTFLPLFHTGGWNVLTTPFLKRGAHIILTQKFDADQILRLSQAYKATLLFGVPTTMGMMAQSKAFAEVNLSSVRYAIVGGEPMPIESIQTWHQKGIYIRQGFGLTEFGPNCFSLDQKDAIRKIGSIGFPNPYIEVKVMSDEGLPVKSNEVGELLLKGPAAMLGYWKNPKANQEAFSDGWLKTGDLVRYDEEGFFFVAGRKKEMFKSGGENVYPVEIEQVLSKIPWVREVAVVGCKDSRWGEVGVAFISSSESIYNEVELVKHCAQNLAKFKIPKKFVWLAELPKSGAGKILKIELLKRVQTIG